MRSVVNAELALIYGLQLFCLFFPEIIIASGGALDASSSYHARHSSDGNSKVSGTFSSLTDGIAQAVAHDAAQTSSSEFFVFSLKNH